MIKKIIFIFILFIALITSVKYLTNYFSSSQNKNFEVSKNYSFSETSTNSKIIANKADKIEILYFYNNTKCGDCLKTKSLIFKIIKEKFPLEFKNNIISFKDIEKNSLVNKKIIAQFQAQEVSLFYNIIVNDQAYVEKDVEILNLTSNEKKFTEHLENKLKSYLKK